MCIRDSYYNGTTWKELIHTEADPQVNSTTTNVIPLWNGSALVDGTIQDNTVNVGIGIAPVANQKLTVNGKTTTTNLQMTSGANNGFVLQSDVTGNATWVNAVSYTHLCAGIPDHRKNQGILQSGIF